MKTHWLPLSAIALCFMTAGVAGAAQAQGTSDSGSQTVPSSQRTGASGSTEKVDESGVVVQAPASSASESTDNNNQTGSDDAADGTTDGSADTPKEQAAQSAANLPAPKPNDYGARNFNAPDNAQLEAFEQKHTHFTMPEADNGSFGPTDSNLRSGSDTAPNGSVDNGNAMGDTQYQDSADGSSDSSTNGSDHAIASSTESNNR